MDSRQLSCDVLVVGGGPGGIAAACAATEWNEKAEWDEKRVIVVDNAPALGGNIWRGGAGGRLACHWKERLRRTKTEVISEATVFSGVAAPRSGEQHLLSIETPTGVTEITADKIILATGARELFLPFPGWTLPNVMGVGGLQALVKQGWPIAGKRVVVAGSGPLLLAVADGLKTAGAKLVLIAEQAPAGALYSFAAGLAFRSPGKLFQAIGLRTRLLGVPYHMDSWVTAAHASSSGNLERVTVTNGSRTWDVDCDYLACGYGLIPSIEFPLLLGCEVSDGKVNVNEHQETSISGIYCIGETCGIGGVDCALAEGEIAGLMARSDGVGGNELSRGRRLVKARQNTRRFAESLDRTFTLRPEVKRLATADTLICRCEDVPRREMEKYSDWRAAKLHTRCGMGPCQGRICGGAAQTVFNWNPVANRPPVLPVRVSSLAAQSKTGPVA